MLVLLFKILKHEGLTYNQVLFFTLPVVFKLFYNCFVMNNCTLNRWKFDMPSFLLVWRMLC